MTSAIDSDLLQGLPSAGSNIGGALKNVAPGVGAIILIPKLASAIGDIPKYIAKGISKSSKSKKHTTMHKIPKYKLPKIKMGPY